VVSTRIAEILNYQESFSEFHPVSLHPIRFLR